MVESLTQNYKWTKPEITKSPTTWGGFLNATTDSIDSILFAAQNAGAPVGSLMMYVGATAPANWLLCNGTVYLNSDIPLLAPILANAFNAGTSAVAGTSSALPNLNQKFPLGAGVNPVGQSGGAFAVTLTVPNLPAHQFTVNINDPTHYHPIPNWTHTHSVWQDGHSHSVWQDQHAHTVGNTQAHAHNIVTGGHNHGIHTGGHNHTVPGIVSSGSGVTNGGAAWSWGTQTTSSAGDLGGYTDNAGNLGGYTDTQSLAVGNTDPRTPPVHADTQYPPVHMSTDSANIQYANWGATNITATTNPIGSGTPFNVVQPFVAINFIVRYK